MAAGLFPDRVLPSAVTVERHRGRAGFAAILPEWRQLADHPGNSPLFGPDWIRAQVSAFEAEQDFHLVCVRQQGCLAAVLPLVADRVWSRGLRWRRLRSATGHLSLRFDLSVSPAWRRELAQALLQHLADWKDWNLLELRHVGATARAWELHQAAGGAGYPVGRWNYCESPYLDPRTHKNGAKFRRELLRTRRQLEERGPVRLLEFDPVTPAALDQFFALEAAGWKGGPGGNAVLTGGPRLRRFYDELASGMSGSRQLTIHHLCCGDHAVAMSLGVRHASGYYLVKWVYDEAYARYGPGHLLIDALLPGCQAAGLPRFDFCGESSAAKRKWTDQAEPLDWLFIFRDNRRGRLAHGLKFLGKPTMKTARGNGKGTNSMEARGFDTLGAF